MHKNSQSNLILSVTRIFIVASLFSFIILGIGQTVSIAISPDGTIHEKINYFLSELDWLLLIALPLLTGLAAAAGFLVLKMVGFDQINRP